MTLNELHDKLFDVLCVVDDICRAENITYFLDSGTLLGAARDHGFIPWDDDLDLKILAEDYPRFKAVMEKNLPPYMKLVEPAEFAPGFYDFVVRICDTRYMINPESEESRYYRNCQNYVGTDIFLFTKTPDSNAAKRWLILSSKILYGMGMGHRYRLDMSKYKKLQKLQVALLAALGKLVPAKTICGWWWKNVHRYSGQPSAFRFCSNYSLKSLQFFPEANYTDTASLPIRDRFFPVPAGYHQELSQQYGDYMTPVKDHSVYVQHLKN